MIKINDEEKLCYIDDEPINLSRNEYNTILFFINNPNKTFSRQELIDNIWKKDMTERSVDVTINRLRKKLGKHGKNIYTRAGWGYGYKELEN